MRLRLCRQPLADIARQKGESSFMNTTNIEQTCPLCGKDKHMGKKAKPLYGHLICRKCYYAFANRRQFAFAVDIILWNVCLVIVLGLAGLSGDAIQDLTFLLFPIFCMKDGFSGSSLGKAMMGVQVIDKTSGQPSGFGASFKRNLPLIIPFMLLIVAFQLCKGNRIGDGWSNTRVIWKKYRNSIPFTTGMAGTLVIQKKKAEDYIPKPPFKNRQEYETWKAAKLKKSEKVSQEPPAKQPEVSLEISCPHCQEKISKDSIKCKYCAEDVRNYQKAETDKIAIALNQGNKAEQPIISSNASAGEKIDSLLDLSQPINETKADLKNKLGRLDEIFKEGIISEQEYKTKKEKLLEEFLSN